MSSLYDTSQATISQCSPTRCGYVDIALMPVDKKVWAAWNFIGEAASALDTSAVCVTYWLNRLQHLPPEAPPMFVTLNPRTPPESSTIIRRLSLSHPVFDFASWHAQSLVPSIQNSGGIFYAGAWCGYGFHEDGMRSSVAVLEALGLRPPWTPRTTTPKSSLVQSYFQSRLTEWGQAAVTTGSLRLILPSGAELNFKGAVTGGERLHLADASYPIILPARTGTASTATYSLVNALVAPPVTPEVGSIPFFVSTNYQRLVPPLVLNIDFIKSICNLLRCFGATDISLFDDNK